MVSKIKQGIQHLKNTLKRPIPGMEKVYIPIATRTDDPDVIILWAKDIDLLKDFAIKEKLELEVSYKAFSYWGAKLLKSTCIEVIRKGTYGIGLKI